MKREIEVKYLLKDKPAADSLVEKIKGLYPKFKLKGNRIVISYFYEKPKSKTQILNASKNILSKADYDELIKILSSSTELVVKARSIDEDVFFVVKGAHKGEDAVHAVNRIEFEVKLDITLEAANDILVNNGVVLASKWYSERKFYQISKDIEMNIEFVSGYGYKAEIEMLIDDIDSQAAEAEIRRIAKELSLHEASQVLLGKMYEYYNLHWQDYFKTKKVFPNSIWKSLGRI